MSAPRVSVVIPAYNAAGFIENTLGTVAAQTFKDFEVIAIDDGSKDDTANIVERFLKSNGLKGRCVRQPNKKIAGARNAGVREASAEFISFLDHDDAWFPEKLSLVMAEFDKRPEIDLVCHNEELVRGGTVVGVSKNGPAVPRMYERLLFQGNCLSPSAVTVKKTKLTEVGGFRENPEFNTVEDYDIWLRLAQVSRFYFLDKALGRWQFIDGGASNKVIYHHANLETMLRDHFSKLPADGAWLALKKRRRLAWVWRAAARALMAQGDFKAAGPYARRSFAGYPLDWKNAVTIVEWAARGLAS